MPLALSRTIVNHKVARKTTQPSHHSGLPVPTEQEATSKTFEVVDTILFQASSTIVAEGLAIVFENTQTLQNVLYQLQRSHARKKTAHASLQKSDSCISVSYSTPALNQAGVSIHHLAYHEDQPVHTNRSALVTMQMGTTSFSGAAFISSV